MFTLGTYQTLQIARKIEHGYILENEQGDEVLLPTNLVLDNMSGLSTIRVFIYKDGEERVTATMQDPEITLNSIALLKVKDVNNYGAFLDWGLDKDLFVPHREQFDKMDVGGAYLVYMYLDEKTNRLAASQKIERFLDNSIITVSEGEQVDLWIWNKTDLGYNVIINEKHLGLIYHNEFFTEVNYGQRKKGYIKQIREDHKIDVTLRPIGYKKVGPNADLILEKLQSGEGFLDLHDKSDPEEIRRRLEMSKKTFKKAIGLLYRKDLIRIEDNGIYLKNS